MVSVARAIGLPNRVIGQTQRVFGGGSKHRKSNAEHQAAQRAGRERFYASYKLRVARVEYEYEFESDTT